MASQIRTNANHKIFIATAPEGDSEENKKYKELNFITEISLGREVKKEDVNFYHNDGETSTYITGKSENYSITIVLDTSDDLHSYLFKLALGKAQEANNQYIKVVLNNSQTSKKTTIRGKCAIEIKSFIPSGKPDELQTMQFTIYPQDNNFQSEETT